MLTRDNFTGPWAGLPVAWTPDNQFDEPTYRADVARCCQADAPGVYTGGTSGEFYAMEFDEFQQVATATVETCHQHQTPAMIGCSSTYTLGAIRKAEFAGSLKADAIQVALPFWLEVGSGQLVEFFRDVSDSCGHLPLSIYETTRAKRILTLDEHRAIHDALPNYLMVKSNAGTLGVTVDGCRSLSEFVNVFVGENRWAELVPHGVRGGCSSMIYWNPQVTLDYWQAVNNKDTTSIETWSNKINALFQFLHAEFGSRCLTDTAYDRLVGIATGFLQTNLAGRKPYPSATADDVATVHQWLANNFPEMLAA